MSTKLPILRGHLNLTGNGALSFAGGELEVENAPHTPCPVEISKFLLGQGWRSYFVGDYERWTNDALKYHGMPWTGAMACEFHRFILLGAR